ncbi:hypothetical protein KUTeg_014898 [Tegillarca granosa]|uniref:Amphiphysin n=1 Tax=Tegillarca granosa TaxID=220873 RepID=A0ABQ9ENI9_TEGGR|nr:hypothetical protein KUTeg_014898 [Tegillarca granosa]
MNRNMAEHSKGGGIFTKSLKKLNRTKTKVLQNLGKAEKTSDERFDEHVHKLERQQDVAHRFQKELRNYINCAKAMHAASKTFYATLIDTYEQDWKDETIMRESLQQLEIMWMDYVQKLQEQVQDPLTAYIGHMPPLKAKISKRGRKLVDFDNTRHNLDVLQNAKKKDEVKIHKAEEELEESKKIYEHLNNELHSDLPDFYNSRVNFYASTFRNLFSTENIFHGELGKLTDAMGNISEKLAKEHESDVYKPRPISKSYAASEYVTLLETTRSNDETVVNGHPDPSDHHGNSGYESGTGTDSPVRTPTSPMNGMNGDLANDSSDTDHLNTSHDESPVYENSVSLSSKKDEEKESEPSSSQQKVDETKTESQTEEPKLNGDMDDKEEEGVPDYPPPQPPTEEPAYSLATQVKTNTQDDEYTMPYYDKVPDGAHKNMVQKDDEKDDDVEDEDNVYEVPKSNKPVDDESKEEEKEPTTPEPEPEPEKLPPGSLYTVQATHPYKGEDVDELTFEAGELIYVIEFENPDDQDDGWLMGIKKSDDKKGVFPENFTKRISGGLKPSA